MTFGGRDIYRAIGQVVVAGLLFRPGTTSMIGQKRP